MNREELKEFLDEKVLQYNNTSFIENDPICIPHRFTKKQDIEISALLTATISWGKRVLIIKNADAMMQKLDYDPYNFILYCKPSDLKKINGPIHRTFNHTDLLYFIKALKNIYLKHNSLEEIFIDKNNKEVFYGLIYFRNEMLKTSHEKRSEKHLSNVSKKSAAKRLNMFLRWMVRKDKAGVDFGIWKKINPSDLLCPLDVHSGKTARKLKLLRNSSDNWDAVVELTNNLRKFESNDPIKYDYALFGLGVMEKF